MHLTGLTSIVVLFSVFFMNVSVQAQVGVNLLQDPGFERYRYDANLERYVPNADAVWREYGLGQSSVTFDASSWTAPEEMLRERPQGFSPGARGFQGFDSSQNSGMICLQQDIVGLSALDGTWFETWVWFAGSGNDDDASVDYKKEEAGIDIFFYSNFDPSGWTDENALERHHIAFNFWGRPREFVRLSGIGQRPSIGAGMRMRIWARTWATGYQPPQGGYNTEIAIDNAYFGHANPNLLRNGNFEQDTYNAEFKHWFHPDSWWGTPGQMEVINSPAIDGVFFSHGGFRPFFGHARTYGYYTYLNGWINDVFTFGQIVDEVVPEGSEMALSFYWAMATKNHVADVELRRPLSWVNVGVDYLAGSTSLHKEYLRADWPVPPSTANGCRYDYNPMRAFNSHFRLLPPAGTTRIGIHVSAAIRGNPPASELFWSLVDDFNLRYIQHGPPQEAMGLFLW